MAPRAPQLTEEEFHAAAERLDELVQALESLPYPAIREQVFEILQAVDAIHREGLGRLVESLRAQGQSEAIERAAEDPVIQSLLLLYNLLPGDELTQAEAALDSVRPYIHSHGGKVEVLDVADGVVHVRLSGACYGCAGSTITLRRGIETALREGFPGFRGLVAHEPEPPPLPMAGFIPLAQLDPAPLRRPLFKEVARLADVPPGTMRDFQIEDVYVLVANAGGEVYAVRDHCPGGAAPLRLGSFSAPILVCPWHNEAYDIRTGKRADGEKGPGLTVLPVAVVNGSIQLAINVSAEAAPVGP